MSTETVEQPKCELCGEAMPPGEEMFKFHGYSGPCPKPPLPRVAPGRVTLRALQEINVVRASRWHPGGLAEWSALEWAAAMAGEAGEACNAAKKLKRAETGIKNINHEPGRSLTDIEIARKAVGREVADTIIYGVLLAARCGVEIEAAVTEAFNRKSEEYGFPERLPVPQGRL